MSEIYIDTEVIIYLGPNARVQLVANEPEVQSSAQSQWGGGPVKKGTLEYEVAAAAMPAQWGGGPKK